MEAQSQSMLASVSGLLPYILLFVILWYIDKKPSRLITLKTPAGTGELTAVVISSLANYLVAASNNVRLAENTGLLLRMSAWSRRRQSQQIFETDIVFLDRSYRVIRVYTTSKKSPQTVRESAAKHLLILNSGEAAKLGIAENTQLTVI